ncbi:MAG: Response regulator receiver domain, partial [Pseudomonadota bacterium]
GSPPVPIIAVTANGRDAYESRGAPAGMNDYLGKPYDSQALNAVIQRHLPPAAAPAQPAASPPLRASEAEA